jgi:ribosomal-protein-alanine N-acetyltransferase
MIGLISRLFARGEPILSDASARDAAAIAALHGKSFQRGWSEEEVESLLLERNVFGHRALAGRKLAGFILSRIAADEAEILSVAVERAWRGRGVGRRLLALHLGRLAGFGTRTVFLEVGENNEPAGSLYARAGFREVARRPNYYGGTGTSAGAALMLRRDLIEPAMDTSSGASI